MQTIIFATNNKHKVDEIKSVAGERYKIISLAEAGITIDIPEPFDTLEENAVEKSRVIYQLTKQNCFSEDTGLEVDALNGEPGVKSARYASRKNNAEANIKKLLSKLLGIQNRSARFRTIISLVFNDRYFIFEGICEGVITFSQSGYKGFGYDPVFIPNGATKTFAEMDLAEKNSFSHRKKATDKLLAFLSQNWKTSSP